MRVLVGRVVPPAAGVTGVALHQAEPVAAGLRDAVPHRKDRVASSCLRLREVGSRLV